MVKTNYFFHMMVNFGWLRRRRNDGIETYLDGSNVCLETISEKGFTFKINKNPVKVDWSSIEFIVAYRTNKIRNSPIRIDLWETNGSGVFPLNSTMKGWDNFIKKLPAYIDLKNFHTLETAPWTQNVMKSMVFTVLYDRKERTIEVILNWKYNFKDD